MEPMLLQGGKAIDDRGSVSFINDFRFEGVKRFYSVTNHNSGFVRAWHGHKKESKFVTVAAGAAILGAVKIDNWDNPSKDSPTARYVLSAEKPAVLFIPAGYANGFMSLTDNTILTFYSTSTLEESVGDDIRFDARRWDLWRIEER